MEILAEENLRGWLLAFCLRYRKGRHRDADDQNPTPDKYGISGDQLLLTAIFPLYDLAKGLLGYSGRKVSLSGGQGDLTTEEQEIFVAVNDRLARLVGKMNAEHPGCWIINPRVDEWHVGVTPGDDPMSGPINAIRPTYALIEIAENEIRGSRWEQYLGDGSVYKDAPIGAGV